MALKTCENCKSEFEGKGAQRYCSEECKAKARVKMKKCVVCGGEFETRYNDKRTCSKKCADELTALTSLERYGERNAARLPEIQAKMQATCKERYGTKHAMQNKDIMAKAKATNELRYGVSSPLKNPDILAKAQATNIDRYGEISALMNPEVRKKGEETMLKNYGYKNAGMCPEFQAKMRETNMQRYNCEYPGGQSQEVRQKMIKTNLERYNRPYKFLEHIENYENFNREFVFENFTTNGIVTLNDRIRFKEYFNISNNDNALKKLKDFELECERFLCSSEAEVSILHRLINKFPELSFESNVRGLIVNPETNGNLEIDILVKKEDTIICAIEYNGIYWHDKENPVKEALKTRLCAEKGFKLFHIWEDTEEEDFAKVVEFLERL